MTQEASRILFIADGSINQPLLHSQGLPLLRKLSQQGLRCYLLSFEENAACQDSELGKDLAARHITWRPVILPPQSNRLQRLSMLVKGVIQAGLTCRNEKIDVIHCRSYRPAVIGAVIKALVGSGFLFDMRGFLIDEQVSQGKWQPKGLKYRLARWSERYCLLHADAIVTTSQKFSQQVWEIPYIANSPQKDFVIAVPNCADTDKFAFNPQAGEINRQQLGWQGRTVLIFSGAVQSWIGFDQTLAFFKLLKQFDPSAYVAFLAYGDLDSLRQKIAAENISPADYCVRTVPSAEMPFYLSAAHLGISFIKNKEIASPVKFGEFLAAGLPVIINPGVGDTERIIKQYQAGLVIDPANPEAMSRGAQIILARLKDDPELPRRCRVAAERELSLDKAVSDYQHVYRIIASRRPRRSR